MGGDENRSLAIAAKATLDRIATDRSRVSASVALVLDHVSGELFTPGFGVADLRRLLGAKGESTLAAFAAELGRPPESYLASARLETASRLLRDTNLSVNRAGTLVGFSEPASFRVAFKRWCGLRPQEFRRAASAIAEREPSPGAELLCLKFWQAVDRNQIQRSRGWRLANWYQGFRSQRISAGSNKATASRGATQATDPSRDSFAQRMVATVWAQLSERPNVAQHYLLKHEIQCNSPGLFDLLSRESRRAGGSSRRRQIELAELALTAVEGSRVALGLHFRELHILALSRLGQAHRLASDFLAAQQAFSKASEILRKDTENHVSRAEAELCLYQGSLRLFQRRFDDARPLLTRAVEIAEQLNDTRLRVTSLLQLSVVTVHQDQAELAIPELLTSLRLARELEDQKLEAFALHDLAKTYADTGDYSAAGRALLQAQALYIHLGQSLRLHQLGWVEGQLQRQKGDFESAEKRWRQTLRGFEEHREPSYAAGMALELAMLYHSQGRVDEVVELLTSRVIPVFEGLQIHREAFVAFTVLHEAVTAKAVSIELLRQSQRSLQDLIGAHSL